MHQDTGYKYYRVSGSQDVFAAPALGNTPSGAQEISYQDFIDRAKNQWVDKVGGTSLYDQLQKESPQALVQGGGSGYTMVNGVPQQIKSAEEQAANELAVTNGTMKKVPVGNGFAYVPVDSAAASNIQNPASQPTGVQQGAPTGTFANTNTNKTIQSNDPQITAIQQMLSSGKGANGLALTASQIASLQSQLTQLGGQIQPTNTTTNSTTNSNTGPGGVPTATSSAADLAAYVKANGLTNLQQYPWWNNNPNKTDAWNAIQGTATPTTSTATGGATNGNVGGTTNTSTTTPTTSTSTDGTALVDSRQAALDIIKNSGLDAGTQALFNSVVNNWQPGTPVDFSNIIKSFNDIKSKTIDPYFQEQSNIFIDQVQRAYNTTAEARARELEAQGINADQAIKSAKASLESSGLTFSGKAIENLGQSSAYTNNTDVPQPLQFGGQIGEGLVNTSNRLIASGSSAQYQKTLQDLQRQAEQTLGSDKSSGLIPGVTQMGNVTGTLPFEKTQKEQGLLTDIYNQSLTNYEQNKPIDLIK
jgi:hypothetical protein